MALAYALSRGLRVPEGGWIVVSVVMVGSTLPNVGEVVTKAAQRVVGTLVAAVCAVVVVFIAGGEPVIIGAVAVVGAGVSVYLALDPRIGYAGLMAALTLVILLGFADPTVELVAWRAANVTIGSAIVVTVSVLILPMPAWKELRFAIADTLEHLADLYQAETAITIDASVADEAESRALGGLFHQRELLEAARREIGFAKQSQVFKELLNCQRAMLRSISSLGRTHHRSSEVAAAISRLPSFRPDRETTTDAIRGLALAARTASSCDISDDVQASARRILASLPETPGRSPEPISPHLYGLLSLELADEISSTASALARLAP